MLDHPNFILIGAAGRNVGKTEFACELIQKQARHHPVIGVKITTVKERDGQCPRGGSGCGVCSSLEGNYMLTDEIEGDEEKDTIRMLNSGATNVYWLRVLHEYLEEGLTALLEKIPEHTCVVCESNSARQDLQPGLFLVVKEAGSESIKESCLNVMKHADKIIGFDGSGWDFQPSEVNFEHNTWNLNE